MIIDRIPVRIRLSLVHGILVGIIFTCLGIGLYRIVEDNLLQSLDVALLTSAKSIRENHRTNRRSSKRQASSLRYLPYWESILNDFFGGPTSIRAYAQMVDMAGTIRAKTANVRVHLPVTPAAFRRAEKGLETFEIFKQIDGSKLRQITVPVLHRGRFIGELIQVAAPMGTTFHTLNEVKKMLLVSLLLGLAVSILCGYILTWWSFKPVTRITREAASLGVSDLDRRLKLPPANDELRILIQTFNEMLNRLEDAFSRLRKFAGNVSHELRTPLAVLKGEAELALRRQRTPVEYQKALDIISLEADNMSGIVENLLLLARAQGRSIAMRREKIEIDKFLMTLQRDIQVSFAKKQITLLIKNSAGTFFEGTPGYLSIALKNILLNAVRHSPTSGKVELWVRTRPGEISFEIVDYGEGITQDSLPYIFDTFYRADSARNRNSGGVGIGLSLAQALVHLHQGTLTVNSKPGQGARFLATIPQPSQIHIDEKKKIKLGANNQNKLKPNDN